MQIVGELYHAANMFMSNRLNVAIQFLGWIHRTLYGVSIRLDNNLPHIQVAAASKRVAKNRNTIG